MINYWILLPVFAPGIAGVLLLASSFRERLERKGSRITEMDPGERKRLHLLVGAVLILSAAAALLAAWSGEREATLFYLMKDVPIYFHIDGVGRLFVTVVSIVWVAAGLYSFVYMKHEGEEKRFFGFYLLAYGVLVALDFSGNLVTMYLFYELLTLVSMPLVLHNESREAIMAALKYLFYSMCGAYLGLFGIFFLYRYCDTLTFTAGGALNLAAAGEHRGILLVAVFAMAVGFGAKAGMFPLHSWLPAAHPVAPSPASAVLSGVIVKAGVLAVLRTVYYVVGPEFLRGTWVQTAWLTLTLITVFMGSMLAYREPVLKKRLAYSTVSQVSYILFGLALMSPTAFTGALLHTVFHAFIKSALFLAAGIFLFCRGKTRVEELRGIGKEMPAVLWCYTFAALALIGIPPASGFISKWYLAQGALEADAGIFGLAGPIVLLVSALLTAGYLLPVTMRGFLPGRETDSAKEENCRVSQRGTDGFGEERQSGRQEESGAVVEKRNSMKEESGAAGETASRKKAPLEKVSPGKVPLGKVPLGMLAPLAFLAALALLGGIFPGGLIEFAAGIASSLM